MDKQSLYLKMKFGAWTVMAGIAVVFAANPDTTTEQKALVLGSLLFIYLAGARISPQAGIIAAALSLLAPWFVQCSRDSGFLDQSMILCASAFVVFLMTLLPRKHFYRIALMLFVIGFVAVALMVASVVPQEVVVGAVPLITVGLAALADNPFDDPKVATFGRIFDWTAKIACLIPMAMFLLDINAYKVHQHIQIPIMLPAIIFAVIFVAAFFASAYFKGRSRSAFIACMLAASFIVYQIMIFEVIAPQARGDNEPKHFDLTVMPKN